ncbi:MAG: sulfotransferase domain-containing protein [Proteobacteria bacterium]|nr:sulfotransferase domain-containing protein [Pseudomonadota bacterium]
MMRRVWLASYLKSGSTWFRVLLANTLNGGGAPVRINALPDSQLASSREMFGRETLIEAGLLTHEEADRLRPRIYENLAAIARGNRELRAPSFAKVHDAYVRLPNGEPLLAGARGADGAIVIVRDPRDIAISLARHMGKDVDGAIAMMGDADMSLSARSDRQPQQLRQRMLSWSGHVESWLDQTDIPVHLVRYEDLHGEPATTFASALEFAGMLRPDDLVARAIAHSAFSNLKAQEQEDGFLERPNQMTDAGGFFYRGESGAWRRDLSAVQVARIETAHAGIMRRIGYRLSNE